VGKNASEYCEFRPQTAQLSNFCPQSVTKFPFLCLGGPSVRIAYLHLVYKVVWSYAAYKVSPVEILFVAFNDETDSTRVNHVRRQLLASERFLVEGYSPFTSWAKTRSGSSLQDLKADFDTQLHAASVATICIGPDCAANPWVRYTIEQCYVHGKPLFTLDISQLPNEYGKLCQPDINPLERFAVEENGQRVYLNTRYPSYTWQPDFISQIDHCICEAKASAARSEKAKAVNQVQQSSNYRNYESQRVE
jgi:hypothetical protein